MRRVPVPGVEPSETELGQWPARGEVYVCRRANLGGYAWEPLFPAYPAAVTAWPHAEAALATHALTVPPDGRLRPRIS